MTEPATWHPLSPLPPRPEDIPWGINLGGGANSTALVVECFNRGLRPAWVLFSDTGDERPETYASIERLGRWCMERDFTPISTTRWIRQDGTFESLEHNCLRTGYMPSKAYGFSGCSGKWKIQPAQRWRKANGFARTVYAVGFDAGEHRRVAKRKCERVNLDQEEVEEYPWYPLYAWGIAREGCDRIIAEAGLPPVPKSACFYCPSNRPEEWEQLRRDHPELYERALAIERNASARGNTRTTGLRRRAGFVAPELQEAFLARRAAEKAAAEPEPAGGDDEDRSCMCSSDG